MQIIKPTLIVNEQIARQNIAMMTKKARANQVTLRPHFKTHQSARIANWFRDEGITACTVSSVGMGHYFAENGWTDITIAFPYNPLEHKHIQTLAKKTSINLLVGSVAALHHIEKYIKDPIGYFLKIDVGTHRTGVDPGDKATLENLSRPVSQNHQLKGLLAHAGHTYQRLTQERVQDIYQKAVFDMSDIKKHYGCKEWLISYGDTPSCTLLHQFPGVDEIRPGNFVFFDLMQHDFGVCSLDQIACCMVCPVVAIHPSRNEAVLYGGAVHLSKDAIIEKGQQSFGYVVNWSGSNWELEKKATVVRLSQEHGIIEGTNDFIQSLKIGDLVGVIPVHSCLTADLQPYYLSLDQSRIEKWNK